MFNCVYRLRNKTKT